MKVNRIINADMLSKHLKKNGWIISVDLLNSLPDYELHNLYLELGSCNKNLNSFVDRIKYHGFGYGESALDFGCGYGQWSIGLSQFFEKIYAVDKFQLRLDLAADLCGHYSTNSKIYFAPSLDNLLNDNILKSSSLDLIFSYSVFMFVHADYYLPLFKKLLKPGGKLYLMVDLLPWHIRSFLRKPTHFLSLGYMLTRTFLGFDSNIIYTRGTLIRKLEKNGFKVVSQGNDYTSSFSWSDSLEKIKELDLAFSMLNYPSLFEVCAIASAE